MRLYNVIYDFLSVWFPDDVIATYADQVQLVSMIITAGLVLFMAYNLLIGWWWKGRK